MSETPKEPVAWKPGEVDSGPSFSFLALVVLWLLFVVSVIGMVHFAFNYTIGSYTADGPVANIALISQEICGLIFWSVIFLASVITICFIQIYGAVSKNSLPATIDAVNAAPLPPPCNPPEKGV